MGSSGVFTGRPDDDFMAQGLAGEWFSVGRGPQTIAAAQSSNFLITNPMGSGKLVMIHRYRVHVTSASEYIGVLGNPTTNLPTTVLGSPNRFAGKPSGVAVVTMDPGPAMSGGSGGYSIPVETGGKTFTEFIIHPTLILPPGNAIGTIFTNTSGSDALAIHLIDWREVPQ